MTLLTQDEMDLLHETEQLLVRRRNPSSPTYRPAIYNPNLCNYFMGYGSVIVFAG